ncbi:MAG: hypothetical protein JXJ20_09520 [Anaerolineae bacterium]|nr:hypothetical protein [Anaerolineae bacterium]
MVLKRLLVVGVLVGLSLLPVVPASSVQAQEDPGSPGPRMLPPTGPYDVGRTVYHWVDKTRGEPHTPDEDDARELMVWAWYPADPAPDAEVGLYLDEHMADLITRMFALPEGRLAAVWSNSYPDAPVADDEASYPVVIFDPGFSADPRQYTVLIEELASYGYVVFSPSHPFTTALTVFPDGRVVEGLAENKLGPIWAPEEAVSAEFEHMWLPDTRYVLEQIKQLNADDPHGLFAGRLDLEHLGMVGHSMGGRTVSEICLDEPHCQGAINLDGARTARVELSFDKPYMLVLADNGVATFDRAHTYGLEALDSDYYVIMILRTEHGNFGDTAFWVPLVLDYEPDGLELAQIALLDYRLYILAFFDRFVLDMTVPLLDGPAENHPEVFFLSRLEPITPPTDGVEPQPVEMGDNPGELVAGVADVWTYDGEAGEVLDIRVMADNPAGRTTHEQRLEYGLLDTLLVVRAPDGSLLAANDDTGISTDSHIRDLVLPVDGIYHIEVRSWESQYAGTYTLLVRAGDRNRAPGYEKIVWFDGP